MDWQQKQRIFQECVEFLVHEAHLLDNHQYNQWFDLLTEDVIYKVPIRMTREMGVETEFSSTTYHMNENRGSLHLRIKKSYSEYNWVENPGSRIRHNLSNFKIDSIDEKGEEVQMRTNLLLFRNKFDSPTYDLASAERLDTLRKESGQWKLAKRIVHLDHATVPLSNLAFFF